jgi:hypothetical protein
MVVIIRIRWIVHIGVVLSLDDVHCVAKSSGNNLLESTEIYWALFWRLGDRNFMELCCSLSPILFRLYHSSFLHLIFVNIIEFTDPDLTVLSLTCIPVAVPVVFLVIERKFSLLIVLANPLSILVASLLMLVFFPSDLQKLPNELFFLVLILEWYKQVNLKHVGVFILNRVDGTYYKVALYLISNFTSLSWIYLGSF